MSRRVLVTGAAGFVGRKLRPFLESLGHEVLACDITSDSNAKNDRACDLTDTRSVEEMVRWAAPVDAVIHLAAITFVPDATRNPAQVIDVNLQGTIRLITALQAHAPGTRLIFVSSAEVYGPPQSTPITEDHPLNPANPYAIAKAAADHYCAFVSQSDTLDIVRIRPFNHSGPGQSDTFVLSSLARQIALMETGGQEPVLRVGNLDAARDFLHVDDVLGAYALAIEKARPGEAYNVCSGTPRPIRGALERLVDMARIEVRIEVDPERLRPVDVPEIYGSHAKFSIDTGWEPVVSFEQLLADLLGHWREHV